MCESHETRPLAGYYNDGNDNGRVISLSLDSPLKSELCHEKGILNTLEALIKELQHSALFSHHDALWSRDRHELISYPLWEPATSSS